VLPQPAEPFFCNLFYLLNRATEVKNDEERLKHNDDDIRGYFKPRQ
jgi:hypothetical protein